MKTLIEDCFALSTKLLKKDLQKARRKEPVESEYLNFIHNGRSAALDYSIEYEDDKTYLVVTFNAEPQKILLSQRELTFGTRNYLVCGCGKKTNTLYLKNTFFACRNCHKLRYKSTTINTSSDHGMFLSLQSKRLKIMDRREAMDRIFYKSRYTKRFMHWLKLCGKAGLLNEIADAIKLSEAINNSNKSQNIKTNPII